MTTMCLDCGYQWDGFLSTCICEQIQRERGKEAVRRIQALINNPTPTLNEDVVKVLDWYKK